MNKSVIIIIAMVLSIVVATGMFNSPERDNVNNFGEVIIENNGDNISEISVISNITDATNEVSATRRRGSVGDDKSIFSQFPTESPAERQTEIPEFPIIALPMLTMIGLFFIFDKRK